ncbi:MAG: translation initiation factor IF-2 [Verrucomicrobia bacterium]|nr:translation initiation factor IF-2 [Verrucomicrobiota bacterium]
MPVRIYEIARKVGLESKDVLAKAKALGIAAARVASSTLDKITAEYLTETILAERKANSPSAEPSPTPADSPPAVSSALSPPAEPAFEPAPEIMIITAPEIAPPEPAIPSEPAASTETPPPAPAELPTPAFEIPVLLPPDLDLTTPAVIPPFVEPSADAPPLPESPPAAPTPSAVPEIPPAPPPPPPPPPPPQPRPPRIGDKVGFIHLKPKPLSRAAEGARAADHGPAQGRDAGRHRPDARQLRPPLRQVMGRGAAAPAASNRAAALQGRPQPAPPVPPREALSDTAPLITMKAPIIVRDLAQQLNKKPHVVIAELMSMNVWATANQPIDEGVATRLCAHFGTRFELEKRRRDAALVDRISARTMELDEEDKPEDMQPRPPVVTIMGHVDHGKTTLLDVIRKSNVVATEAGGITQHIGAYTIAFPHPDRNKELQQITFLDTPGHAAFSAMRARGANVTDIVILVVAANDGVMPQTLEALNHAKAATVPLIVAVNKCDHPNANPLKVRQQLKDRGLAPDDWGGDTIFVDVSALTKQGVDKLLSMVLFQAEMLELKANPKRRAKGNVIESGIERSGPIATVLVRKGTLRVGDVVLCDRYYGKVRALINEDGSRLKEAGPSQAVQILGLNGVPEAGIEFTVHQNEKLAREEAQKRLDAARLHDREITGPKVSLETIYDTLAEKEAKVLRIIVKADTQGSEEAIVDALNKIQSDKVELKVLHSAVGTITKDDIVLASSSKAVILGFHTRIDAAAAEQAKREGVQIKLYSIIYELIDEVRNAMAGLLEPLLREVVTGAADVRKVIELSKGGNVAGCMVTSGRVVRGKVRVTRRRHVLFEGQIASLRRFQEDASEVRAGMECGIRLEGYNDFQVGDTIECYTTEKTAAQL